jgi:hypothetical protein
VSRITDRVTAADGVFWTVEMTGVLVMSARGCPRLLTGLEAAAWDLLSRGDRRQSAIYKLTAIGRLESPLVEAALNEWLESWRAAGWVGDEDSHG